MSPLLTLSHYTLVSALGRGVAETYAALRARRSGLTPCDFADVALETHIGRVIGVEESPLEPAQRRFEGRTNRLAAMALHTDGFRDAVERAKSRYGADRIGVVLGTSTSGILESENAYRRRSAAGDLPEDFDFDHTHDMFAVARLVRSLLGLSGPAQVISTACSSSAKALIEAHHFIAAGICDACIVGGADSLCRMTLYGFAALELLSKRPCRPCGAERDGISVGEAAGFALVERPDAARTGRVGLLGYGASSDAHHMSSPHPEGLGAAAAMHEALARARLPAEAVDYVNLHGTGTKINDATEDRAVLSVLGDRVPCSSTKGWTGHTMGSAGIVELVISALSIEHGLIPGCLNLDRVDPLLRADIRTANEERPVALVMSNSFGFGGSNCSLLLGAVDP